MSKRQLIMLFGALIIILALFAGFPGIWNSILNVIIGLLIIIVAYTTRPTAPVPSQDKTAESVPYVDAHVEAKVDADKTL